MITDSEEAGLREGMEIVGGSKRSCKDYKQTRGKETGDDRNNGGDIREGKYST